MNDYSINDLSFTTTKFPAITIPQGATINSAVLTYYVKTVYVKNAPRPIFPPLEVKGINTHQPTPDPSWLTPTYPQSQGATSVFAQWNKNNWVKDTLSATLKATKTMTTYSATGYNARPEAFDVKDIVQRLVDQFAYSNDAMYFDMRPKKRGPYPTIITWEASFYGIYTFGQNPSTPATSYGNGPHVTKLIIDFSAAVETTHDFTVDAIPLLAPYLRSCTKQDAILIQGGPPPPPHIGFEVAEAILDYLTTNGDKTGFELLTEVINPVSGRPYTNHSIKNSIGWLQSTNQITGNPYVPPLPEPGGSFNFKKTTWTIV